MSAIGLGGATELPVRGLELDNDPAHSPQVRNGPGTSAAGHDLFEPVQQLPEGQGGDDMAVLAIAFFRDETPGPVLGVDRPLRVIVDEALLADDLIKRQ